jgi:NAD(P)-dependent dehydrogenase (short-subunit alcohol dehydrogenase family)
MRLQGKVAIITGAGKGIGMAVVKRLLAEGAQVVGAEVSQEGLAALGELPGVLAVATDVTQQADIDRLVAQTIQRFGKIDILVNNAGVVDAFMPIGEMTDALWERVMNINLTAPFKLARAALPHLLAQKGVIVNVSSVAGLGGGKGGAAYVSSKHGLIGLSRNIAASYGPDGLRCVVVAPGGVDTGISLGGQPSERGMAHLQKTLAANLRMASSEELASVIVFAASDEASFINGAVITADGGWTAL